MNRIASIIILSTWFIVLVFFAWKTKVNREIQKVETELFDFESVVEAEVVEVKPEEVNIAYEVALQAEAVEVEKEDNTDAIYTRVFGYIPSEEEIKFIKLVTMAEGGNTEPIEGLERIMEVIANRCRDDWFPDTITEVAHQKNQFQTVMEGTIWKYDVNDKVEQAWNNLIRRGYCTDEIVLFFTAGGYNPYCTPMYKLGNHYFGR